MTVKKRLLGFIIGNILMLVFADSISAQTGAVTYVHDPCIIRSGDYYYLFSTGDRIEMRRSPELNNWIRLNQVFQSIPEWGVQEVPGVSNIWAPDIFYRDSTYYLSYALSTFGSNRSRIGLASNKTLNPESPDYKWIDKGKMLESNTGDSYNAIDPNIAEDNDGRLWLSFGSFWDGIKLVEIDSATMKPYSNAKIYSIARRSYPDAIEAPFIVFKNGYYYLFVSFDYCCQGVNSSYNVRVGRSTEITGPYKDRNDVLMTSGGGTPITQSGERWKGPGHCAVLIEGEKTWLVYHAYDAQSNGIPTLRMEELFWDNDNWPGLQSTVRVGTEKQSSTPDNIGLYQNYPNPFNPTTTIEYIIPQTNSPLVEGAGIGLMHVQLKVYNSLGGEIVTLVNEYKSSGSYEVKFDGGKLVSGVYFYHLQAGNFTETKKLILLK